MTRLKSSCLSSNYGDVMSPEDMEALRYHLFMPVLDVVLHDPATGLDTLREVVRCELCGHAELFDTREYAAYLEAVDAISPRVITRLRALEEGRKPMLPWE
jgi:hypothetical protein